jgi:hypothetical protein
MEGDNRTETMRNLRRLERIVGECSATNPMHCAHHLMPNRHNLIKHRIGESLVWSLRSYEWGRIVL